MKKLLIIGFTSLLLWSCKSKNDKIQDFVKTYNASSSMISNYMIKSTKAISSGPDEITIEINTNNQESDELESGMITSSLPELIGQGIKSERSGNELLESGVKFKLKIINADGKVIANQTVDKNNLKGNASDSFKSVVAGNPKASELNTILEVFNKNLPMEDKATGTKVMSIKADEQNNIVYTTEVPDSYKTMLEAEGADQVLKDEMLRMPQVRQILTKTEALGVKNLKYKYIDTKGKTVKEITISKEDLK
ncbi:hypothetical protein A0O34_02490 [Chryseobacterium glaciei]|uniref:Uncharacterized protein n=1 Tax=Chryseobacterium glaciei TaxID=1685010 RepID=A0A172XR67_9FLAO|nr:hypothetical protein [Chryseobacterium glaciei]ANF49488.1 hypothetical protein A0O34_02490 [Chryseobacterium glaciei]